MNLKRFMALMAAGAAMLILPQGCGSDGGDESTPAVNTPVKTLLAPSDMAQADLKSVESMKFQWSAAEYGVSRKKASYTLLFDLEGGDMSNPIYAVASDDGGAATEAVLARSVLNAIAGNAGAAAGGDATVKWAVRSTDGTTALMSDASRRIKITRVDDTPVGVLTAPADNASADLKSTTGLEFRWEAAQHTGEGPVTYEVVFDYAEGGFSSPLFSTASGNGGTDLKVTLAKDNLDAVARQAGALAGASASVRWAVRSTCGGTTLLSDVSNAITIIRVGDTPVKSLVSPINNVSVNLGTSSSLKFQWGAADYVDDDPITYTVVFDALSGDFSSPLYEIAAGGDGGALEATLSREILDVIAKDAGAVPGGFATFKWAVRSTDGANTLLSSVSRLITIIRAPDTPVRVLAAPAEGASVDLNTAGSLRFQWEAAVYAESQNVGYELVFDVTSGNFSSPVFTAQADNGGASLEATLTKEVLDQVAKNAGGAPEADVTVKWAVRSTGGASSLLSEASRRLTITRAPDPNAWTWAQAADSCTFILIDQFLNKSKGTFWASSKNVLNNSGSLYWQQAYPMHTLIFSYQRIKETDPTLAAQYLNYISLWITNNGNNWYGSKKNGFYNQYTDDMAWMALVFLHLYETIGTPSYLTYAKDIYGYMIESKRVKEDDEGWGLIWRIDAAEDAGKDTRNACTNTPAMIVACKLYQITGTAKYLDEAVKLFNFMTKTGNRVQASGAVGKNPNILTYTQGTWTEGCRLLYHITGETKYMDRATTCMKYTMSTTSDCTTKTGLLRGEGTSADQSNFKGGLIPYMVNYANDPDMPSDTREQIRTFLKFNAETLWFGNMNRSLYPKMFANFVWNQVYTVDGNPGSLGAHNSGAALIEGMTRLR